MGNIFARGINEDNIEKFKEYVLKKYGKLHGTFSREIDKAIEEYLERRGYESARTHTHQTSTHSTKKSKKARLEDKKDEFQPAYANGGEFEMGGSPDLNEPEIPPSERTKRKIVRHLEENGMMEAESISENAVRRVIGKIAGHDKRTIDKYFRILEEESLLPRNMEITVPYHSSSIKRHYSAKYASEIRLNNLYL